MKIVRFISGGRVQHGVYAGESSGPMAQRIEFTESSSGGAGLETLFGAEGPRAYRVVEEQVRIERWLAPLVPTDILCIGLNYRDHAAESGSEIPKNPMLFIKAGNTLNDPFGTIAIPRLSSAIDFEGELVIVIGKLAKNVQRKRAMEHIFGYTCGNDVSAREWQRDKALGGGQFARGKSFDGFCPLGPWIVTADEVPNPNALRLRTVLNGQVMQDHTTADMIFDVPTLIESLSSTMTLRPGTVIMTGTPHGVGFARKPPVWMKEGDRVVVEIEKIGRLENGVGREMAENGSGHL